MKYIIKQKDCLINQLDEHIKALNNQIALLQKISASNQTTIVALPIVRSNQASKHGEVTLTEIASTSSKPTNASVTNNNSKIPKKFS